MVPVDRRARATGKNDCVFSIVLAIATSGADLEAGGDFEGATEAVNDGFGPAGVRGDADGDFVPTGAGVGAEDVSVGDDRAGGDGSEFLAAHAVPGEGCRYAVCSGRFGQVEPGSEGGSGGVGLVGIQLVLLECHGGRILGRN